VADSTASGIGPGAHDPLPVSGGEFRLLQDRVSRLDAELDAANRAFRSLDASHSQHGHEYAWRSIPNRERWTVAWGVLWRINVVWWALLLTIIALALTSD
jgi:hypothetical protein